MNETILEMRGKV